MQMTDHSHYMKLALQLAERGRLTVSPNPMVGCVIVKNSEIVGQGYHERAGEPHAEIHALNAANEAAKQATLYVTLEPCAHTGKTPPCINAIIAAGIKKIYVACVDPNPLVAGKGIEALRAAGIEVEVGLEKESAQKLNEIFFHYITTKRPFVIAKWAMSLDGKTVTHSCDDKTISGEKSQHDVHALRESVDAILIGAKTAVHDNPLLTVRYSKNAVPHKHPARIILASRGELPTNLKIFANDLPGKTIIATTHASKPAWRNEMEALNVTLLILPQDAKGRVDLTSLLNELGAMHITSLLVEGGREVHDSFFATDLVNKVQVYVAPNIIANLPNKKFLTQLRCTQLDSDYLFTANYKEKNHV